jgi:hypothetical protein
MRFAATDTTALVRGTVSDHAGRPLAGVKVVAMAKIFKIDSGRIILGQDSTLTSDSGTYVLPALELNSPGVNGSETEYGLTFNKAGYRQHASNYDLASLKDGDSITYDVRLAKVIDLTVIVGKAGTPESSLAGAGIVLSSGTLTARTGYGIGVINGNGMYTFADVDTGVKSITVALEGFKPTVIRRSISERVPTDSVRILLEKSNPDSMRTLVVKTEYPAAFFGSKDTMLFSTKRDSLTLNLFAIGDSGVFTFRNIPDTYASGNLIIKSYSDTTSLTGPITQKKFIYKPQILSISKNHGPGSGNAKGKKILGPVPYYFDGKSGKSLNVLGKPRASGSGAQLPAKTP